jgi:hypothetical protein
MNHLFVGLCALVASACAGSVDQSVGGDVSPADLFDISPPLSDLVSGSEVGVARSALVTSGASFEGIGEGFTGPAGPFSFPPCPGCGSAPADAFLAVGPQHVVQVVHPILQWGQVTFLAANPTLNVVDPVDGCTFWYAGEYFAVNGLNNWHTRIGSFRLPGCG